MHLRKLVESPLCTFCQSEEETLIHLFWECETTQTFWLGVQGWLQTNFIHCSNVVIPKEIVILGHGEHFMSDRVFDLMILIAKQHIFTCKMTNARPQLNVFVSMVKNRFLAEKYRSAIDPSNHFFTDWLLYQSFFA